MPAAAAGARGAGQHLLNENGFQSVVLLLISTRSGGYNQERAKAIMEDKLQKGEYPVGRDWWEGLGHAGQHGEGGSARPECAPARVSRSTVRFGGDNVARS
jgi:hypothetical protein